MNAAQLQTLKELIELLKQNEIGEFSLEQQDLKVQLKFAGQEAASSAGATDVAQLVRLLGAMPQAAAPAMMAPAATAHAAPAFALQSADTTGAGANAEKEAGLHTVKSPIVGTFYEASSPGAPPFVKPGDVVESGQVLCIVEAMKLMNEIEADASGEIVKRLVTTGQPVEYGQALFLIRPR
ncbi:MAG TPA: acetyl-CoA carboxylase biotin carboxyl carrier protein [Acidobacteriaceae bacterium]|jgi:acetyl-CoA carboxylase biotin carboxyl carrier protein|nr:acetyl-CoA carboxylase biotin carboxyl carrier protein [Acidobacteriaceae bacterium]